MARLTEFGEFDASFDADGKQTIAIGSVSIVLSAWRSIPSTELCSPDTQPKSTTMISQVARLTLARALDAAFSGDGKATFEFESIDDQRNRLLSTHKTESSWREPHS